MTCKNPAEVFSLGNVLRKNKKLKKKIEKRFIFIFFWKRISCLHDVWAKREQANYFLSMLFPGCSYYG